MNVLVKVQVFKEIVFNQKKCPPFKDFVAQKWVISHFLHFEGYGQITISSDPSPVVGIEFLAIPFAFDFAFKTHIKEKSFKHSIY